MTVGTWILARVSSHSKGSAGLGLRVVASLSAVVGESLVYLLSVLCAVDERS